MYLTMQVKRNEKQSETENIVLKTEKKQQKKPKKEGQVLSEWSNWTSIRPRQRVCEALFGLVKNKKEIGKWERERQRKLKCFLLIFICKNGTQKRKANFYFLRLSLPKSSGSHLSVPHS